MLKNIVVTIIATAYCFLLNAQTVSRDLAEEVSVYQKVYDTPLSTTAGESISLNELYSKKPLLIGLIYSRCPGVCNPFLLQLKQSLAMAAHKGSVNLLILSFDPRDGVDDMSIKAHWIDPEESAQWTFAVTDSIARFNKSIGFSPAWDSIRNEYDHEALLVGINTDGYITKKLIGIRSFNDLNLLISSVNNVFSPSYRLPDKNTWFSCFNYDPATGKNTPGAGLLFIALPSVLTLILLITISLIVRNKGPHSS